jgi:hypothetical protein
VSALNNELPKLDCISSAASSEYSNMSCGSASVERPLFAVSGAASSERKAAGHTASSARVPNRA